MAKQIYGVIGGSSKKITKGYAVIDGVARKIKKMYAVIGGVTKEIWGGGSDIVAGVYKGIIIGDGSSDSYCYAVRRLRDGATLVGNNTYYYSSDYTYYDYVLISVSEDGAYLAYNRSLELYICKYDGSTYKDYCSIDYSDLRSSIGYEFKGYSFFAYNNAVSFDQHGNYLVVFCAAAPPNTTTYYASVIVLKNNGSSFVYEKIVPITTGYTLAGNSGLYYTLGRISKDLKVANIAIYDSDYSKYEILTLYDTGDFNYKVIARYGTGSYDSDTYVASDSVNKYFTLNHTPYDTSGFHNYVLNYINNGQATTILSDGTGHYNVSRLGLISNENGCIYFYGNQGGKNGIFCYSFNGSTMTQLGVFQGLTLGEIIDMTIDGTVMISDMYYGAGTYIAPKILSISMDNTGLITGVTELESWDYETYQYSNIFMIDRT